jgi:hypothetical protein
MMRHPLNLGSRGKGFSRRVERPGKATYAARAKRKRWANA